MSLNVAIVGAGWMGETHARAVAAAGDTVAMVIDSDHARAAKLAGIHNAQTSTSLNDAHGMDAAIIATPSAAHLAQSEMLAELGLNILVEKPHRFPNQSAENLKSITSSSGKIFQVGMTTRFHPGIQAIAEAVHSAQLGEIVSYSDRYWFKLDTDTLPDWYFDPRHAGGGVLLTNGVHILDRCRWILGEGIDVTGIKMARMFDHHHVEDFAAIHGTSGPLRTLVDISLLWTMVEPGASELAIVGTKGVAIYGPKGWFIETESASRSGPAPKGDEPFVNQWRDFRDKCLGRVSMKPHDPGLDMLEMTLNDIEHLYRTDETNV